MRTGTVPYTLRAGDKGVLLALGVSPPLSREVWWRGGRRTWVVFAIDSTVQLTHEGDRLYNTVTPLDAASDNGVLERRADVVLLPSPSSSGVKTAELWENGYWETGYRSGNLG